MSGTPVVLGPFPGGINNKTDRGSIEDSDLYLCDNFIYGIDGTLIGRYPIVNGPNSGLGSLTAGLRLLGSTVMYSTVATRLYDISSVVFGANDADGTWVLKGSLWSKISVNTYQDFVAYGNQHNKVYFPSNPYNPTEYGGYWAYNDANVTTVSATPAGTTMALHKERLWIAGNHDYPSRIFYSKLTPNGGASDWDVSGGAGFIDVDPGNGQAIVNIKAFADAITIFKDDSTYVLSYDGNISRGQLIQVNGDIGTENNNTVVEYKNILAVYHEGKVYAYGNGSFSELNTKLKFDSNVGFVSTYTHPISLSMIDDALILRHYDKLYYYSFITGGWGTWTTTAPVGNFVQMPVFIGNETKTYLISSVLASDETVYQMKNAWNSSDTETFTCKLITKTFNFGSPYAYSRLFWWGIEAVTNMSVKGIATPISGTYTPTWGELLASTWGDLVDNVWGNLFTDVPDVVTGPISAQQGNVSRRMYKFLKGLRFREINFTIELASDGTTTNGPPRLLSIVPFLKHAEIVVKQVS